MGAPPEEASFLVLALLVSPSVVLGRELAASSAAPEVSDSQPSVATVLVEEVPEEAPCTQPRPDMATLG